jgi:hypothetical protein
MKSGDPFAFAGVWTRWKERDGNLSLSLFDCDKAADHTFRVTDHPSRAMD